jgi:hypothetical protein
MACLAVILVTAFAVDAAVTRVKAMHVTPGIVKPGMTAQGAVELSVPAPMGGVTVKLESSMRYRGLLLGDCSNPPARVSLPTEVFIPAGKTTGLFDIEVRQVDEAASLLVTATHKSSTQTVTVYLVP